VTAGWVEEAFEIAGIGLAAFTSTNLDNLVLLTVLQGQAHQSKLPVFLGYIGSIATIVAVAMVATYLAEEALPVDRIGYLGLVPIALGIYRFISLGRLSSDDESAAPKRALGAGAVAALTMANGGDTAAVLLPLFAETAESLIFVLAGTIVGAAILCFVISNAISERAWVRHTLVRVERWLVPALLIMVGGYVLLNSSTDTLPGS